ncbi:hypothetical protein F8388_009532 [Cannabis sativa]|uniref:Protein TIC 20 n=2 Tax=Cannabis sativa TaxID=3483 RepID=A0AB40EBI3_CANSA|nr:hypothetical protein G4B88_031260 [Cannabis sativa]KAF4391110.1 hypothetical protein F8388_009532 [Cannabis sativa]
MASIPLVHFSQSLTIPNLRTRFPFLPHPLTTPNLPNLKSQQHKWPKFKSTTVTRMSYNKGTVTPATDRLVSAVAYTLPFFNSLQYGRHLFMQYPKLGYLFDPLLPIIGLYRSIPYASFVAFFALYLGVVRNPSFTHYVRFNSMQAVTLDVLLVLPLLLQRILSPGRSGLGFRIMVWVYTALFVFSVLCFVYSLASCVLGRTPYLPIVADAAARQI